PAGVAEAVAENVRQVHAALSLARVRGDRGRVMVAYEPQWAIGADEPADPGYIRAICGGIQAELTDEPRFPGASVIYGGSAGPGLLPKISQAASGLFLGRFAHNPAAVSHILDEACLLAERGTRQGGRSGT
ncbi:MAG: triose-phosphate isomerase, partial [Micrococcales bacterium]|nr:triose-phosphate isomerase [Micrococcales bacterium]